MKIIKLIIAVYSFSFAHAQGNVIDNPELLYSAADDESSVLKQSITINRTFNSINDLLSILNKIDGIQTKVQNQSADKPQPVKVILNNGTINELLQKACPKLGYSWKLLDGVIIFSALKPQKLVVIGTGTAQKVPEVSVHTEWILDPKFKTLRNALSQWCKKAGWQLVWNVKADYPITTVWNLSGTFEGAVNEVLKASQNTDTPLQAIMHDSNRVLEIYTVAVSK